MVVMHAVAAAQAVAIDNQHVREEPIHAASAPALAEALVEALVLALAEASVLGSAVVLLVVSGHHIVQAGGQVVPVPLGWGWQAVHVGPRAVQ